MAHAHCMLVKATLMYSAYVIFIAFLQQKWLHEPASIARYTYIACLVATLTHTYTAHYESTWFELCLSTCYQDIDHGFPKYPTTFLLAYLLHGAESFLKKLTGLQLVKKFPAFYETRRFITALTSARHLSLS
jgi:hypothetical protein